MAPLAAQLWRHWRRSFGATGGRVFFGVTVGALAGLIPALVAVRVKVIDAIRF
ncbi:hypothetical protein [Arthrobacter sp. A5]|uniref:hypothetical protein n=1 Tax=Arthrobacter sp. A5 TaxID=576926 RepID=UPI003DA8CBE8